MPYADAGVIVAPVFVLFEHAAFTGLRMHPEKCFKNFIFADLHFIDEAPDEAAAGGENKIYSDADKDHQGFGQVAIDKIQGIEKRANNAS